MLLEEHLSNEKLKIFLDQAELSNTEVLARLTERVQRDAGSLIVQN